MTPLREVLPAILVALSLSCLLGVIGKLECEDLPIEDCAFSVSSSGARCVLEKYRGKDATMHVECQSSIIMAEKQEEWIESDECVKSCGLERMSFGLSTDLLLDSHFQEMLCSPECLNNCPNIIDLYISLAAGEGMYLPQLCKTHKVSSRRLIVDPIKKAMDEQALRRLYMPRYTSDGALAPMAGGHIPENGASGRGYGPRDGPRLGMDPTPAPIGAPPIQKGSGIDTSTNPSPPAPPSADIQSAGPSGTPFNLVFPKNLAGQPSASPSPSGPSTSPSPSSPSSSTGSAASPPATAPGVAAPSVPIPISYSPVVSPVSYDPAVMMFQQQQQQESLLQQQVKAMADGRGLDDEELLYEAYFH